MIFLKSLWPILLFKIVLSYLIAPIRFHILFFVSPYSFESHIQGQDKQLVLEDDHRRTIHNEE